MAIGTIYTEFDLDFSKFEKNRRQLIERATRTSLDIEENFHNLGVKTNKHFDMMRMGIQNSFEMIKRHAGTTHAEMIRAQEAFSRKMKAIDEEQFGKRTSMLESFKKNWLATTAIIAGITATGVKVWGMAKVGAGFDEQMGILDNLARKYKTTADTIISEMDRASKYQIAQSELMTIALGGIAKGLSPEQLINLANAAETLGDVVGKTATEALKELTEALETGRARGLKNYLGAALDLEATFGDLAKKMTDAEKAQAMYNITMLAAIDIQSRQTTAVDAGADAIARVEKKFQDATTAASRYFKRIVVGLLDIGSIFGEGYGLPKAEERPESDYAAGPGFTLGKTKHNVEIEKLKEVLTARKDIADTVKKEKQEMEELTRLVEKYSMEAKKSLGPIDEGDINQAKRLEDELERIAKEKKKMEEDAARESEKVFEKLARKREKEQEKMEKDWEHFWESVQDFTADTFYDLFTNIEDGWQNLLDRMKDWFLKWIAQIAAQQITMGIKNWLFGGSAGGGAGGLGGILGSLVGVAGGGGGGGGGILTTGNLTSLASAVSSLSGYSGIDALKAVGSYFGIGGAATAAGGYSAAAGAGAMMGSSFSGAGVGAGIGAGAGGATATGVGAGAGFSAGLAAIPLMIPTIGKLLSKIGPGPKTNYDMMLTDQWNKQLSDQLKWVPGKGLSSMKRDQTTGEMMGFSRPPATVWRYQAIEAYTDAANKLSNQFSKDMLKLIKILPTELGKQLESRLKAFEWGVGEWDTWWTQSNVEKKLNESLKILIDAYNEIFSTITDKGTKNVMEIVTKYNNAMVLKALLTPQWEQFVMGLKTSDLAPVQSMETFSYYYKTLQDKVRANPGDQEAVDQLLQYTSGSYLPFAKSYTGAGEDYASIFNQIVSSSGELYNAVFGDIKSVTDQFNELIDYLKEVVDRPIKISVNLNGTQIAKAVAVAVDKGNVVIPNAWEGGGGSLGNVWDASGGGP